MKAADLPLYYNMCEILEHNLETRAEKTALFSTDGSMTFREVSSQVNQVGNALAHPLGCVGLGLALDGMAV